MARHSAKRRLHTRGTKRTCGFQMLHQRVLERWNVLVVIILAIGCILDGFLNSYRDQAGRDQSFIAPEQCSDRANRSGGEAGCDKSNPIGIKLRRVANLSPPTRVASYWDEPCAVQSDSRSAYSERWNGEPPPVPLHPRRPSADWLPGAQLGRP